MMKTQRFIFHALKTFPPLTDALEKFMALALDEKERAELLLDAIYIIEKKVEIMMAAWKAHPDYMFNRSKLGGDPDPWNPMAVAVFEHEPGQDYLTESYIISGLVDLMSPKTLAWGNRTLGEFSCILPIEVHVPTSWCRQTYVSYSFKGAGGAYRARMELKRLLPRKYHPLITHARRINNLPKHNYLPFDWKLDHQGGNWRKRDFPPWYNAKTRDQFNFERYCEDYYERLRGISTYILLKDFWKCSTGKVHPHKVKERINYQMDFDTILQTEH